MIDAPQRRQPPQLESPTRRRFVVGVAALLLGSCGSGSGSSSRSSGSTADAESASQTCALYPEETEGPYYQNIGLMRSDITEGKAGTPLTIVLQVLRESGCDPISGVDVEVWHADASGVYSDESSEGTAGETQLRGTQTTDAGGRVQFQTIYPGWYAGRTTHVHFKVHVSSTSIATSQIYFPEDVTAAVYATAPYSERGEKDTSNAADSVYRADTPPLATVSRTDAGYEAELVVTVAT